MREVRCHCLGAGKGGVVGERPSFVEHARSGYGLGAAVTWLGRLRATWKQARCWARVW
jgi:hypothetical protein